MAKSKSKAKVEKYKCEICNAECESTNCCEVCAVQYGPCCNSMRNATCVNCTDGGSDDE